MSIKLCTIDLDGTLLNNEKKVLPEVKEAIQKARAKGVKIVLCTGRPLTGVTHLLEELEISGDDEYVATYNGSVVETVSGKVISSESLSYDDYLKMEMMSRKLNVPIHVHVVEPPRLISLNRNIGKYSVFEAFLTNIPLQYRAPEEITPDSKIIKIMYIDEAENLQKVLDALPQEFYDNYTALRSEPFFFEMLNKKASKGQALLDLAKHLGIKQEETMAIGDNENDLSMVETAGIGVAMGNAVDSVKAAATFVTKTNEEAGVAYAIEKYIL